MANQASGSSTRGHEREARSAAPASYVTNPTAHDAPLEVSSSTLLMV